MFVFLLHANFCYGVLVSCSTHVMNESFPSVRNHHIIDQSLLFDHSTSAILDRTKKTQVSIIIFTDFKSRFDASKLKVMSPILVCKFFFKFTLESSFQYRKYNIPMHRSLFLVLLDHGVEPHL